MRATPMLFRALLALLLLSSPALGADDYFLSPAQTDVLFLIPIFLGGFFLFYLAKKVFYDLPEKKPGFLSITPHKPQKFFEITEEIKNMEPVVSALADPGTNVYSNLAKITLSAKGGGLYLEEKNYKISILINRRRARRYALESGDILDMGELTLLYVSPQPRREKQEADPAEPTHLIPRTKRATGKMIKSFPTLIPSDERKKTYHLTKNLTFIGRSEMNDLVTKSKTVAARHSKIEKVAGRYKITDLDSGLGTFVNGRRVETKFLRDGDVISFESVKYTFSFSGKQR